MSIDNRYNYVYYLYSMLNTTSFIRLMSLIDFNILSGWAPSKLPVSLINIHVAMGNNCLSESTETISLPV